MLRTNYHGRGTTRKRNRNLITAKEIKQRLDACEICGGINTAVDLIEQAKHDYQTTKNRILRLKKRLTEKVYWDIIDSIFSELSLNEEWELHNKLEIDLNVTRRDWMRFFAIDDM